MRKTCLPVSQFAESIKGMISKKNYFGLLHQNFLFMFHCLPQWTSKYLYTTRKSPNLTRRGTLLPNCVRKLTGWNLGWIT